MGIGAIVAAASTRNGDSTLTRFGGYRATGGKLVFDRLLGAAGRGAVVSDGTQ